MKCTYKGLDYRDVPEHALDNNIPHGRGMIKWAPFATMPEQYEAVDRMKEEQDHISKPALNTEQLQTLELGLRNNIGNVAVLRYWNSGYEVQVECKLEHIDNWSQTLTISKDDRLMYIQFEHIYELVSTTEESMYDID